VFCAPDGRPFYGGTYYPPEPRQGMPAFRQVLTAVAQAYRDRRDEVLRSAGEITEALARRPVPGSAVPSAEVVAHGALRLLQRADGEHGGFGGAPKFPTPPSLDLLLAAGDVLPERKAREALDHVVLTCREMARGGLYDQLGGGFHRYSVDARWCVPHFEKMLYDQGQLLRTYVEAWRRSGANDDDLLWPVRETAIYLHRELRAPDGGWYASQDADSEGEEGLFYVWTPASVTAELGDAAEDFCAAYSVTERGNFEHGTTVLMDRARKPRADFASERGRLFAARSARIAPGTDHKRVASWNALCISGLARAGALLGDAAMIADAARAADFLAERLVDDRGRLLRVWNEGRAHVLAFLDDHAALLEAHLDLYRAGAGERFLARALANADAIATRFFDAREDDLFLTPSDGEPLAPAPALRPRRRHAALDRARRARAPAHRADHGSHGPARRGAARAAHERPRARARARGVPDARARRAVRRARRLTRADRGRPGRSRGTGTRRARAPRARSRRRGDRRGAGRPARARRRELAHGTRSRRRPARRLSLPRHHVLAADRESGGADLTTSLPTLELVLRNYTNFNARALRDALLAYWDHIERGGKMFWAMAGRCRRRSSDHARARDPRGLVHGCR
jgi:hypothetical protein